jgi:hypothetical protein
VYDVDDLDDVAPWASGVAAALPPTVEMTVMVTEAGSDVPLDPARKVVVVTATAFADTIEDATAGLAPIAGCPLRQHTLVRRELEATPFEVLFRDFGGRWREGSRFASDNVWTDGDFTDTLLPLRATLLEAPSPSSFAFAGMSPDPSPDEPEEELPDMAFSMYARTFVACYAMWQDPTGDHANVAWLRSAMAELEKGTTGHYVAEADLLAAASRAPRSFTEASWERLLDLRRRIDPDGRFASYLAPPAHATAERQPTHRVHETSLR